MSEKQQKIQYVLAFKDKAQKDSGEGTEAPMGKCNPEKLAIDAQLMEKVCLTSYILDAMRYPKT